MPRQAHCYSHVVVCTERAAAFDLGPSNCMGFRGGAGVCLRKRDRFASAGEVNNQRTLTVNAIGLIIGRYPVTQPPPSPIPSLRTVGGGGGGAPL